MEHLIVAKGTSWTLYKIHVYVCFNLNYILNGKETFICRHSAQIHKEKGKYVEILTK